jgi:ketosteroid isomerase-like protein
VTRYLLIPATLLLCGCVFRHGPVAPEPARGPARDSLFRLDQTRGDSAARSPSGLFAAFAPNAAYLRAGAPVIYGREAADRAVRTADADDGAVVWEPLGGGVSDDLRSAYTYGISARTATERPASVRFGRYLAYWERGRGAPWRIVAYVELGAVSVKNAADIPDSVRIPPPEPRLAKEQAEERVKLRSADSAFSDLSYRMGTGYAFSNTVAEDGVIFGSPELRVGPRAIQEGFAEQTEVSSLTWTPVYVGIAGSRDLGYTIGEYVSTGRGPSGAAVQRLGKYLTVWRRQKDGTWRFVADAGNPSPSPAAK